MVDLIIRDLDDETMLQIMARENMQEWGTSAAVEQETVRAVIEAYAAGQIDLPEPEGRTGLRYAPSFVPGGTSESSRERPYNGQVLAEFLGWVGPNDGKAQKKVVNALAALQFIEEGILTEDDFIDLSTKEAEAVIEQARRTRKASEASAKAAEKRGDTRAASSARTKGKTQARKVARAVGGGLRRGEISYRQAATVAAKVVPTESKPPPDIAVYAERLSADLNKVLNEDRLREGLDKLTPFRDRIPARIHKDLIKNLDKLADRAHDAADRLAAPEPKALPKGA